MKSLAPFLTTFLLLGCAPDQNDIRAYGEERFIREMLAVADGHPANESLRATFNGIRIEQHLNGAWILIKETDRYQQGIYVDRESISNQGGSGIAVSPWTKQIGWVKEKMRIRARTMPSSVPLTRVTLPAGQEPRLGSRSAHG
jgi:hypothetical protein